MRKRIIIAGIYRSASTWLYNVVRLICEQHGTVFACFADDDNYPEDYPGDMDFQVLKVHKFHDKRSPALINEKTLVLTSYRDYTEIVSSMHRLRNMGATGNYAQPHQIGQYMEWLIYWNQYTKYMMKFWEVRATPEKVIDDVAYIIDLKCDPADILKQVAALKPPAEGVDSVTLLHKFHITGK